MIIENEELHQLTKRVASSWQFWAWINSRP